MRIYFSDFFLRCLRFFLLHVSSVTRRRSAGNVDLPHKSSGKYQPPSALCSTGLQIKHSFLSAEVDESDLVLSPTPRLLFRFCIRFKISSVIGVTQSSRRRV